MCFCLCTDHDVVVPLCHLIMMCARFPSLFVLFHKYSENYSTDEGVERKTAGKN